MELLKQLIEIRGASSDEGRVKDFILEYVHSESIKWKTKPTIIEGIDYQDCLILVFGNHLMIIIIMRDTITLWCYFLSESCGVGHQRLMTKSNFTF